jgi:GTP-sensing pleiotropic transcriptional regulator CodY
MKMTNEEFAEKLISRLCSRNYISWQEGIQGEITEFLQNNNLQVINTKQQLLGYSIEYVIYAYEDYYNNLVSNTCNLPPKLTTKQAEYILELADRINSNHDCDFSNEDIHDAIDQWIKEGMPELY